MSKQKGITFEEELVRQRRRYFSARYHAAQQIIDVLNGGRVAVAGRAVADLGCGDGSMTLGLAHTAKPRILVGFDVKEVSVEALKRTAAAEGFPSDIPECLSFRTSKISQIPAANEEFDIVYTWSVFEHAEDPVDLLREMRRILKPDGVLMLQLFPFFQSEHGSHLNDWFEEGFVQLRYHPDYISRKVRENPKFHKEWAEIMLDEYSRLNRVGLDDLQRALLAAGFRVTRFQLMSHMVDVPELLAAKPLSELGIEEVKLLAVPTR